MTLVRTEVGHEPHEHGQMGQCIDACLNCHRVCLHHASQHCLEVGGSHVEPKHFRLMLACAQICQTSADIMLLGVEAHRQVCGACAQICDACAESCAKLDDMQACVDACHQCAEACRQMAQTPQVAPAAQNA